MPSTGQPLADLAVYVASVLVALGTIHRYIWPALRAFGRGVRGAIRLYQGTQRFVHEWFGDDAQPSMAGRLTAIETELRNNGGSTLRDLALTAAEGARRVESAVHRLEGYASQNREGIADLRDGQNELTRRLTDVDEKADALGERVTDHRRRNSEAVEEIRQFLHDKYGEAMFRAQALEASVHELLMVEGHEQRPRADRGGTDGQPDHEPDL